MLLKLTIFKKQYIVQKRFWYIYFAVCTSVSLFSLCPLLTMMHFLHKIGHVCWRTFYITFHFDIWYFGPIWTNKNPMVFSSVCILSTSSNNVEEVAILFSVVQPFTTKAGGGMRVKLTAWCSKNLQQNLCNCGYGVPNHE